MAELNTSERTIFERLPAIAARFGRADALDKYADEEPPLRSELFSADQMEQHGKSLAAGAPAGARPRAATSCWRGWPRTKRILVEVCDLLTAAVAGEPPHHAGRANGCSTTST